MAYINHIETASPAYKYNQTDLGKYIYDRHPGIDPKKIDLIYAKSSIKTRYSVLPDFSDTHEGTFLFKKNQESNIQERLKVYKREAVALGKQAALKVLQHSDIAPTHLIAVTCTGLSAPGLDFDLIKALKLPSDTQRYGINFMGCFAAFHALKLADTICKAQSDARVLVVCVELCSLHQHVGDDLENVVANSLFADGAAACMVSNTSQGLELLSFIQDIVPSSSEEMAWEITPNHFLMRLSSYVPELIQNHIEHFTTKIAAHAVAHHAVHPGGRKILEAYQKTMGLQKEQLAESYETLEEYGNMSSPTILFVLKRFLDRPRTGKIFASGFGPGLTMEGMVLV